MSEPRGAIATRNCLNPFCLVERGERHEPDCTPDTTPHDEEEDSE